MPNSPINQAMLQRRVDSLFRAMATDFLLREQFVTNPSQVIAHYVSGSRLSPQQESALNHIIYSVSASPRLLTWLRRYAVGENAHRVPLARFLTDFSAAVASNGGHFVVGGLLNAMLHSEHKLTHDHLDAFKGSLIHIFGNAPDRPGGLVPGGVTAAGLTGGPTDDYTFNTFVTQGTWTGTGTDTTWSGTVDTGTIFTAGGTVTGTLTVTDLETWHTGTDTTGTDSTGTETTGTETTGTETTGTEATGTEFTGTETTGTETTGTETTGTETTGTETTGTEETGTGETGTETTGTEGGLVFSPDNYAAITLIALSQYAQQLARIGALAAGRQG